jgi:basic membrane protein A
VLTSIGFAAPLRVGLVLDKGGRDDKSFNAAAFRGATDAEKKLGIHLKVVESSDDAGLEPSLRTFARKGFDLIIGIGFIQANPVTKVATEFPKTSFLIVDSVADLPNVRSVMFDEHDGCYLVGVIAGLTSKTKTIGFVGGMDIPLIRRFELGYRSGAQSTGKIRVISNYVGSSSDAWRNPTKGKELALAQIAKSADVIFQAAGSSGLGVFDAVEEQKKFVIGVDSNQNWIKPGRVLTSMVKRVDLAVYRAIEDKIAGRFSGGPKTMGLSDGGIDYAIDDYNRALLTPAVKSRVDEIKKQLLEKKILVPDYYVLQKTRKSKAVAGNSPTAEL